MWHVSWQPVDVTFQRPQLATSVIQLVQDVWSGHNNSISAVGLVGSFLDQYGEHCDLLIGIKVSAAKTLLVPPMC